MRQIVSRFKKGQSLAEMALLVSVVIGSLVAMQVYVRRGLQARYKTAADMVEGVLSEGKDKQFEPLFSVKAETVLLDSHTRVKKTGDVFSFDEDTYTRREIKVFGEQPDEIWKVFPDYLRQKPGLGIGGGVDN